MLVDINDFPSFYGVPRKVAAIAEYILHAAFRYRREREKHSSRVLAPTLRRKMPQRQDAKLVPAELLPHHANFKRTKMD